MRDFKLKQRGFTLIELLVVIFIIGILATFLISNLAGFRARARDARRKSDLQQIKSSLILYYSIYREYPESSLGQIVGCREPVAACDWGKRWYRSENVFMKELPNDPLNDPADEESPTYYYEKIDVESFYLKATLENVSDKEIASSQARCQRGVEAEYIICQD